jgi:ABC-type glycerol-3-phosphate transport system substrate-binding protein
MDRERPAGRPSASKRFGHSRIRRPAPTAPARSGGSLRGLLGSRHRPPAGRSLGGAHPRVWRDWYATTPQTLPFLYEGTEPFRKAHPGVDVQPVLTPQLGGMIPYMLAGSAPDVFQDWVLPGYVTYDLVLDLMPFIKQDNVDLSIFPSHELAFFQEVSSFGGKPGALYFLPCYIHTQTIVVNQSALDEMGLPYPDPHGMTWEDWIKAFRSWTVRSSDPSKRRYGGEPDWLGYNDSSYNFISPYYLYGNGGGYVDPSDPTKSLLGTEATIRFATEYLSLMEEGVLGWGDFPSGQSVSSIRGTGVGMSTIVPYWRSFKWDFYPPPVFPVHQAAYSATDAYGIWNGTKYPELAWEFFKFLTIDPTWARFMMKLQMRGPAQRDLWDEWAFVVRQVVPSLRDKNLEALTAGPKNDLVYPGHIFRYSDQQVRSAMGATFSKITAGNLGASLAQDVAGALTALSQQIEAIQRVGQEAEARQVSAILTFKKTIATIPPGPHTEYPAPPREGVGVPASPTPYIRHDPATGTYTLLADGWDVWLSSDNPTFACMPVTATEGEWWCRLVAISNLTCPHISQWSKFGIMARADLSDDAPMVTYHVDGGTWQNIEWQARGIAGTTPWGQAGLAPSGVQHLVYPNTGKYANYLIRPVWLKLSRKGLWWTPYMSFDGRTWIQLGQPQTVEMGGCWIGIMACSHNGSFNDKGYARAVFDNLSFQPTEFVQLGDQGVPPAAGPVPPNWATQ